MQRALILALVGVIVLAVAGYLAWTEIRTLQQEVGGLTQEVGELAQQVEAAERRASEAENRADLAERRIDEAEEIMEAAQARAEQADQDAAAARSRAQTAGQLAEQARLEAQRSELARAEAEKVRKQAEEASEEAAFEMELARLEAEMARKEAQRIREQRERELDRLEQALGKIAETQRTALGMVMRLGGDSLEFDFDKADLRPENRELLSRIAGVLLTVTDYQIQIFGHTDDVGTADYNQQLSERRAGAVRDYLVEAGVDPEIMSTKGYGKSQPLIEATDWESRQRNRRVEIAIVQTEIDYGAVVDQ